MSKAIGYRRVSADSQAESGLGLAAQQTAIEACALRLGLDLVETYATTDEGVSSVDPLDKRPELLEAIAALGKGDVLIVAKRDRLGRDPIVVAMIEAAVARRGARIVSAAGEGTETDGPTDVLMRRIVDAFAEYERLIIKARTKAALGAKRKQGEKTGGRCPYGFRSVDGPRTRVRNGKAEPIPILVPDEAEQAVLAEIREMRAAGWKLQHIAADLNRRGIFRREGSRWDHRFVSTLLKRAA
jgi:DNA invertase Pin-like site-specific DNA recombinase